MCREVQAGLYQPSFTTAGNRGRESRPPASSVLRMTSLLLVHKAGLVVKYKKIMESVEKFLVP